MAPFIARLTWAATLALGAAASGHAQSIAWEKLLHATPGVARPEFVKRAVATPQGTVFCPMAATGDISTLRSHFWLLDAATGDSLWQRPGRPQLSGEQAARLLPNGNFGFVTVERVAGPAQLPVALYMQQFTPAGTIPWRVARPHPAPGPGEGEVGVGLVPVPAPAGGYLLASQWVGTRYPRNQAYLLSATDQGVIRWQKGYSWGYNDDLLDAQPDAQGKVALLCRYLPNTPSPRTSFKLMQVDPVTGDSLRAAVVTPAGTRGNLQVSTLNQLLPLADGGLLLTGQADTATAQGRNLVAFAIKVDAQLRPVWTHLLPLSAAPWRYINAVELRDGSALVLAEAPPAATYALHHLDGATGRLLGTYPYASAACASFVASALAPGADGRSVYVTGACLSPGGGYVARLQLPAALAPVVTAARPPAAPALQFTLYPNPAATRVTLQLAAALPAPAQVELRNALGRVVRSAELPARQTELTLPLAGLPTGLYHCCLWVAGRLAGTQKLVVLP